MTILVSETQQRKGDPSRSGVELIHPVGWHSRCGISGTPRRVNYRQIETLLYDLRSREKI